MKQTKREPKQKQYYRSHFCSTTVLCSQVSIAYGAVPGHTSLEPNRSKSPQSKWSP